MNWLAILRALLSLSTSLSAYLQEKQLIDAGEAKAIVEGLKNAQVATEKARKARRDSINKFNGSNGVPDDKDPNLRD